MGFKQVMEISWFEGYKYHLRLAVCLWHIPSMKMTFEIHACYVGRPLIQHGSALSKTATL
jgi:hypothetical protein